MGKYPPNMVMLMDKKQQVLVIHGGMTFDTNEAYLAHLKTSEISLDRLRPKTDWKSTLSQGLRPEYDVLTPRMPNGTNARYNEWRIWFERIYNLLDSEPIVIGHSLGGIFLFKYFTEHTPDNTVKALIMIAAPFEDTDDESLGDFICQPKEHSYIQSIEQVHLFHSTDDPVVPYAHMQKYKEVLPDAHTHTLEERGHVKQDDFPELVNLITDIAP